MSTTDYASKTTNRVNWEGMIAIMVLLAACFWAEAKKIPVMRMMGWGILLGVPALIAYVYVFHVNNVEADKMVRVLIAG